MCENPTQAATILTGKLSDILDTLAPVKTFQVRKKYAAWLSDNTKGLIKLRNEAQAKDYQNNEQDYWREYKNLKNRVTAKLRSDKKEWEKNKLDGAKHNPATLWKNVKSWLTWGNSGPPSKLSINGELLSSPYRVAEAMNSFFISKVELLRNRIPQTNLDPVQKLSEAMQSRQCVFNFRPVTPTEVRKIITELKNTKSTGTDDIDTWSIKLVVRELTPAIAHILNP